MSWPGEPDSKKRNRSEAGSQSDRKRPRLDSTAAAAAAAAAAAVGPILPSPSFSRSTYPIPTVNRATGPAMPASAFAAARPPGTTVTSMSSSHKGKGKATADTLVDHTTFRPQSGARKFLIKNLRTSPHSPGVNSYYQRTRTDLQDAVISILDGVQPKVPYERLHRGVEDLCRHHEADQLYDNLTNMFDYHLSQTVRVKIMAEGRSSDLDTLKSIHNHWTIWNSQTNLLRSIFSYLDQTRLLQNKALVPINDVAIDLFRTMITDQSPPDRTFRSPSHSTTTNSSTARAATPQALGDAVVRAMSELVHLDRLGDRAFRQSLFKDCIAMLHVAGLYEGLFETEFLVSSTTYFREFSEEWSAQGLKVYIHACRELLIRESHRGNTYNLDSTTMSRLLDSAHTILIKDYAENLPDSGVAKLLDDNDVESIRALYELLRLSNLHRLLKGPWTEYISKAAAAIIGDVKGRKEIVVRLLELRRRLELIVRDGFSRNGEFRDSMRTALSLCMNGGGGVAVSKIGEMVAKYMDMLLRGGLRSLPPELLADAKDRTVAEHSGVASVADEDAELDRQLDSALVLFRIVDGKDTFEAFYKKDLARRVLLSRSVSHDAERSILSKLRGECGPHFTYHLEQMFRDQDLAKDEMEAFVQWRQHHPIIPPAMTAAMTAAQPRRHWPEFDVRVLSSAAWPTYPDLRLNLPDEVGAQLLQFHDYYKAKYSGRTLSWKSSLATCVMRAHFPRGDKELCVSGTQAVLLALFNDLPDGGFLTREQLGHASGLEGDELDRTLQSLACGRLRVLAKHPRGRDVGASDTFTVNLAFTDPKFRIKINQIQLRETATENRETHERVVQDRRFETQAAVVRVMKSRKTVGHAELVAEVTELTKRRGPVDAAAIKKVIEILVDKEYLERDGKSYHYLA